MPDSLALRTVLKSQYHASLAMLRDTIDRCPEDLWLSEAYANACWQIAYHTLFFTHLYLLDGPQSFEGWSGHQHRVQHQDGIGGPPNPESSLPRIPRPYTRAEALTYWQICDDMIDAAIDRLDLERSETGFYWCKMTKFEHQLVNLRHIQHHTAQLADRLRQALGVGTRWVGTTAR